MVVGAIVVVGVVVPTVVVVATSSVQKANLILHIDRFLNIWNLTYHAKKRKNYSMDICRASKHWAHIELITITN